jgi:hypothetical protein
LTSDSDINFIFHHWFNMSSIHSFLTIFYYSILNFLLDFEKNSHLQIKYFLKQMSDFMIISFHFIMISFHNDFIRNRVIRFRLNLSQDRPSPSHLDTSLRLLSISYDYIQLHSIIIDYYLLEYQRRSYQLLTNY